MDNRRLMRSAASALEPPRSTGAAGRPDNSSDAAPNHFASINPVAAVGFARQTMPRPRAWARPTHTATARPLVCGFAPTTAASTVPNSDDDEYSCVRGSGVSSGWSDYSQLRQAVLGEFRVRQMLVPPRSNRRGARLCLINIASAKHRVLVTISPYLQTREFFFHFV